MSRRMLMTHLLWSPTGKRRWPMKRIGKCFQPGSALWQLGWLNPTGSCIWGALCYGSNCCTHSCSSVHALAWNFPCWGVLRLVHLAELHLWRALPPAPASNWPKIGPPGSIMMSLSPTSGRVHFSPADISPGSAASKDGTAFQSINEAWPDILVEALPSLFSFL